MDAQKAPMAASGCLGFVSQAFFQRMTLHDGIASFKFPIQWLQTLKDKLKENMYPADLNSMD